MQFTTKQINEIAQSLQCGEAVYIEKANGKIHIVMDMDNPYFDPTAFDEGDLGEIYERLEYD